MLDAQWQGALDRRRLVLAESGTELKHHALAWALVIVVYTVAAGVMCRSIKTTLIGFGLMVTAVVVSMSIGALASLLAPAHYRRILILAWARMSWWMHAPWLVISLCAALIVIVGVVDRAVDAQGQMVIWTALIGLPMWLLACFIFLHRAIERLTDDTKSWLPWMGTRQHLVATVMGVSAFAMIIGACLLGGIGGAFSVDAALEIVGDVWF